MRPLSLLLGASLFLPATASAQDVAAILVMQGEVTLSGGRAGEVGLGLQRGDTIYVGEESAAVLHLHNDWLVRVDEDLELEVSDIVLLDAPASERSIDDQLDDLLYPDERESMPGIERAERVAGWHSRLTATQAPPSLAHEESPLSAAPSGFAPSPAPPQPTPMPEARDVVEEIARAVSKEGRRTRGGRKAKRQQDNAATKTAPLAPEETVAGADEVGPLDDLVSHPLAELVEIGDGRACLDEWLGTLPVDLAELQFTLHAEDGVVHRVVLDRGLTAPPCLREMLVGESLDDASLSFTITLSE